MRKTTIFLLISLALILRLYHFFQIFHWSLDEEYWAYLAYNVGHGFHLPLIGGNIGGTGLYTTPWFVYISGVVSALVGGSPIGLGIFALIVGLITILFVFKLGRELFGIRTGFISAFICALSLMMVLYDRRFWNPMLLPLITTLTIYSVHKIRSGQNQFFLLLAIALALGFSIHGLTIILLIFSCLFLFKTLKLNKWFVLFVGVVIISISPLLIFDLKHDFVQLRHFTQNKSVGFANRNIASLVSFSTDGLSAVINYSGSNNVKYIYTNNCLAYPQVTGSQSAKIIAIAILLFAVGKSLFDKRYLYLTSLICLNLIMLFFWQEKWSWYYLLPSVVPFTLIAAKTLAEISRVSKIFVFILLMFFAVSNISKIGNAYHEYGLEQKLSQVKVVNQVVGNKSFNLDVQNSDSCQRYGYRYLFTYTNNEPVQSYIDNVLGWLYDFRVPNISPQLEVTIIDKDINIGNINP